MPDLILVYVTKSDNTGLVANAIAEGARAYGLSAASVQLHDTTLEEVLKADAIGIGSPTYEQNLLPPIEKFLESMRPEQCDGKLGIAFGSYGWSGEAPVLIAKKMRELRFDVLDPVMMVQYDPDEKDVEACKLLGKGLAMKLKNIRRNEKKR